MKLQSKYDINQKVYKISQRQTKTYIDCPACNGAGFVTLANGERVCPDCYGRKGNYIYGAEEWSVERILTIGEVRVTVRNFKKSGMFDNVGEYQKGSDTFKVEYMCYETGIGSGSIHYEYTLFKNEDEAVAECAKLNSTGESK